MNLDTREKLYNIANYIIIGLVSVIGMAFIPMIGTELGLQLQFPDTMFGWVVWIISKLSVAILNMLVYHCFLQQAKINVKNNEKYIKAKEILHNPKLMKKIKPHGPGRFYREQYLGKGTTLFFSSLASCIGFGGAILQFNVIEFLSLAFTFVMGIIFGYLNMRKAEVYWTDEYYQYALMIQEEIKEKEKDSNGNVGQDIQEHPTTSSEESV